MKRILKSIAAVILLIGTTQAQEFPIAVGPGHTFGGGADFDGNQFLFALCGDTANPYSITAQFVTQNGSLLGNRISFGETGSSPMVAFDGTNFLVAWTDSFPTFGNGDTNGVGNVYGRFVSPLRQPVGSSFTIASGVNIKWGKGRGLLAVQDTTYFLTYTKGGDHHSEYLYGQRLNRSGDPVGSPIQISEGYAREVAVAFDGTNYLVAWCKVEHPNPDKHIYGQFVSAGGTLVGSNFLIDAGEMASDNPASMIFDGSKFWVAFHEQAADTTGRWNLFARFVSTSGVVTERIMICDSSKSPTFASAGFDGTNYLISWMEFAETPRVRGRYFNAAGSPLDTAFTLFGEVGGKFPIGGVGGFVNGQFVLSATRTDGSFTDGDVYGLFLPGSVTAVAADRSSSVTDLSLSQNYPNPFNPATRISFTLQVSGFVSLRVFDLLGREVATLLEGHQDAGTRILDFDASHLPSGIYFYRLEAGTFVQTRRMAVVK